MAPPKKDAFSDLFSHASNNSLKQSLNLRMASSSIGNRAAPQPDWNLDLLPAATGGQNNQSRGNTGTNRSLSPPNQGSEANGLDADLLSFFESKPVSGEESLREKADSAGDKNNDLLGLNFLQGGGQRRKDMSLLDDEFTDAFSGVSVELAIQAEGNLWLEGDVRDGNDLLHAKSRLNQLFVGGQDHRHVDEKTGPQFGDPKQNPVHMSEHAQSFNDTDAVLAALVSEGFSVEISNNAIANVGPSFEECVQFIIRGAGARARAGPTRKKQGLSKTELEMPFQKDLGIAFQDMSTGIYKKASWLFDKSKKTVIKNINNIQQQMNGNESGIDNGMPAWIRDRDLHKDRAVERRKSGGTYEDYGDDEENIDQEQIQRIVRAQRERESQRRQERLNAPKPGSNPERTLASKEERLPSLGSKSRSSPNTSEKSTQLSLPKRGTLEPEVQKSGDAARLPEVSRAEDGALESVDLLGLGVESTLSRAQKFKASPTEEIPVSRRRRPATTSTQVSSRAIETAPQRSASSEPLNAFQQSDYETYKAKGSESFATGDYGSALTSYHRCLESLPGTHELRIVILLNVALTAIKLGDFKLANQSCDDGINLVGESAQDTEWLISGKPAKYWYLRLLTRKAESLEMLENFPRALELYLLLVGTYGVNDKKIMDAKRRVNNVINPPKPRVSARNTASANNAPKENVSRAPNKNLQRVKAQHSQEKSKEEERFQLHDRVHEKVQTWSTGKEDNLRSLLLSLSDVLPPRLGFPFITTNKITMTDLMLTKKVKAKYMKVISSIHPDKLGQYELEDQMICQATFVILNRAWDTFKEQNNIS